MGGVTVVNLMGRVFMVSLDCPFRTAEALLDQLKEVGNGNVIIVDFHAEATFEKQAMGRYLMAGWRVSWTPTPMLEPWMPR